MQWHFSDIDLNCGFTNPWIAGIVACIALLGSVIAGLLIRRRNGLARPALLVGLTVLALFLARGAGALLTSIAQLGAGPNEHYGCIGQPTWLQIGTVFALGFCAAEGLRRVGRGIRMT